MPFVGVIPEQRHSSRKSKESRALKPGDDECDFARNPPRSLRVIFFLSLSFGLSISGDATGGKVLLYGPDSRFLRGDGLRDPCKNTSQ